MELAEIIKEVEALVAQIKAAAADGKLSLKELLSLASALTKLLGHVATLI